MVGLLVNLVKYIHTDLLESSNQFKFIQNNKQLQRNRKLEMKKISIKDKSQQEH